MNDPDVDAIFCKLVERMRGSRLRECESVQGGIFRMAISESKG